MERLIKTGFVAFCLSCGWYAVATTPSEYEIQVEDQMDAEVESGGDLDAFTTEEMAADGITVDDLFQTQLLHMAKSGGKYHKGRRHHKRDYRHRRGWRYNGPYWFPVPIPASPLITCVARNNRGDHFRARGYVQYRVARRAEASCRSYSYAPNTCRVIRCRANW